MPRKKIIKVLWIAGLLLVVLGLISLELLARVYRQRAGTYFHSEFSQRSDLQVAPFTTSVSVWEHFPRLTFTFHNIRMADTSNAVPLPILSIKQASVAVPLRQFWLNQLRISLVELNGVVFRQCVDKKGNKIGELFRPAAPSDSAADRTAFSIPRIIIRNAAIVRENEYKQSVFSLQIRRAEMNAQSNNHQLELQGQLTGNIGYIGTRNRRLLQREAFTANGHYTYIFRQKKGVFTRTHAVLNGNKLIISGWHAKIRNSSNSRVNITMAGKQPVFFLIKQIMPAQADSLRTKVSSGSHVFLNYLITGISGPRQRPRSQLSFALQNGTFFLPSTNSYIREVNFKGEMDNGLQQDPGTGRFILSRATARLNEGYINLKLQINDFSHPRFSMQSKSRLSLAELAAMFSNQAKKNLAGTLVADFKLNGYLPPTPSAALTQWLGAGYIGVENARFRIPGLKANYQKVNGQLVFKDNQINFENLNGLIAGHPFRVRGTVHNYFAYLFKQPQLIRADIKIKANVLDVDWLPKTLFSAAIKPQQTGITPVIHSHLSSAQTPLYTLANTRTASGVKLAPARWWLPGRAQIYLQANTVYLPGPEKIINLMVQVNQNNQRVELTGMRFTTSSGGTATAKGGFRLTPAGIRRPYLNIQLHYPFLDLQTFMQDIASLKAYEQPLQTATPQRIRSRKNAYFKDNDYQLNLRVTAQKLQYQYLHGSDLFITASLNRREAKLQQLQLRSFGGLIAAQGQIQFNASGNTLPVKLRAQVEQINLQQLFTIADNMQLDVLNSQNIRGTVNCNLSVTTELDATFAPSFDRTVAYARANFRNMELIEVEPIQNALRFLRKERTRHLFFEDVNTHFILRNNEFITPDLNLNNNVAALTLSGNYIMRGPAKLNLAVNVFNVLFGNNQRRIDKIQAADSLAEQKEVKGQHLILVRQQDKYKIKLSSKKEREANVDQLNKDFRQFLQQYQIDTVFTMNR